MVDKEKYLQYGKLHINLSRIVYIDNQKSVLTRMEFDVLYFLASNPDIAFTKEQIYEAVSKDDYSGGAYIIRDIIYRLRTKLKITNIRTLHGYGYKFSTDMKRTIQCRNLSMEKTIYLFYIYFIQIFEVYNITQLSNLVGLYFFLLNNQMGVLCFSLMRAVAVAVRIFKLLSSHSESSLSNSWYVSFVF